MKRLLASAFFALLFCGVSPAQNATTNTPSSPASQITNLGNVLTGKQKKGAQPDPNDLSNVDKDKIARIEQMPDVQDAIQQDWDQLRKSDMQLAYGVNLTENWGMSQDSIAGDSFDRQRLYVNPVIQSYVNHVGQRLVPRNSSNVYTFRVLYDPIPKALTLSTGTIYISTGLLSMLDTEAELSYVLAHEIAHIELRQAFLRIRDKHVEMELAKEKAEKEKMITDVSSLVMGAGLGGAFIPLRLGGLMGGTAGLATGMEVGHYFIHPQLEPVIWGTKEEDDADDLAVHLMLEQGYDPRDVLHLFTTLNQVVSADSRMGLGFMGSAPRVKGREAHLNALLNGMLQRPGVPPQQSRFQAYGCLGAPRQRHPGHGLRSLRGGEAKPGKRGFSTARRCVGTFLSGQAGAAHRALARGAAGRAQSSDDRAEAGCRPWRHPCGSSRIRRGAHRRGRSREPGSDCQRIEGLCCAIGARSRRIARQHAVDLRLHEHGRRYQVVSAAAVVRRAADQQPGLHDYGAGSGDPQGDDAGGSDAAARAGAISARHARQSQAGNGTSKAAGTQDQHAGTELGLSLSS
jgi:hypothetical protein